MNKIYAILTDSDYAICFQLSIDQAWELVRVEGERNHCVEDGGIYPVLQKIDELIHEETKLANVHFYVLYAEDAKHLENDLTMAFQKFNCDRFQFQSLQTLCDSVASTGVGNAPDAVNILSAKNDPWLKEYLLPLLVMPTKIPAAQYSGTAPGDNTSTTIANLRIELAQKDVLISQLQARINALQLPGVEHLLVYLPAIYRNFWGVVRPDELALLAGTLTVPVIASPYPDPSPDTVVMLKRRFLQLPELDRERVLEFCRELPHRLDVRVEMKDLFGEM
jgi:hypothetical protein